MTDILAEIDKPDGVIPVTPESVAVLVAEIRRLRSIAIERIEIDELRDQANARRLRYGFNLA